MYKLNIFQYGLIGVFLGGEPYIGVPATIYYPMYDHETGTQNFPFRTVAMLCSLTCLCGFSALADKLFKNEYLSIRYVISRELVIVILIIILNFGHISFLINKLLI